LLCGLLHSVAEYNFEPQEPQKAQIQPETLLCLLWLSYSYVA
jgi:hypothetical protein